MMLDDFFTLTEMNNGLTVTSRVKDLVEVMQKESDSVVKNASETTRQWSAVASAIAATENQDCLSLFIHLDGHHFIGKWLKDALNFANNSSDSCLEESIIHLLQALGKLHVNYEKIVSTDIWRTVKDLLVHNSLNIQEKARVLFETWETKKSDDASPSDVIGGSTDGNSGKVGGDVGQSASWMLEDSLSAETSVQEQIMESSRDDKMLFTSSEALNSGKVESTQGTYKIISPSVGDERLSVHADSPSLLAPSGELHACSSLGANSIESCNTIVPGQVTLAAEINLAIDTKSTIKAATSVERVGRDESFKSAEEKTSHLSTAATNPVRSVTESGPEKFRKNEAKSVRRDGSWKIDSDVMDHSSSVNPWRTSNAFTTEERVDYVAAGKSSASLRSTGNMKNTAPEDHSRFKKLDVRVTGDNKANDYKFGKRENTREPYLADRRVDIDMYGIVDPLEVARQVAIEVQREVVDFREQHCSSSEKLREYNEQQPSSPNSVSGKQSNASRESPKEEGACGSDMSDETSPMSHESASSIENPDDEQTNEAQDLDNSQVTEVSQGANTENRICSFDLNQELFSEDFDGPGKQASAPVSIVSASRAAAVPGLPLAPLQFEGNLGWKGSAATSAFRPASPRRMSDSEKDLSTGRSSASSKQRQGFLGIDLNVAESMDSKIGDLLPDNILPFSFAGTSGECSVSTRQIRPERFDLDLNCISEDGGACAADLRVGQLLPQGNGYYSMFHSSSSTSKQPSLKSIDLNDQPSFLSDFSDSSYLSKLPGTYHASGAVKSDDSVISIMGTRVEVNRKEFVPPNPTFPNGRTSELAFDVNMGRTGSFMGIGSLLPYTHSSGYGYHNIAPGPPMPFPPTLYASGGPIPYMVDSRGAPVIPQIIAPATGLPAGYPQSPFSLNMPGLTQSNGGAPAASTRSSFDLNSGMATDGGGSRNPAGFTQFLNLGQVRPTDEQLRANSHVGGKRKEAENAWDHYPFKHHPHSWK